MDLVNLGGNVQALGTKTDGSKWRVAVQSPDDTEDYLWNPECCRIKRLSHRVDMSDILNRMVRRIIILLIRKPDILRKMDLTSVTDCK